MSDKQDIPEEIKYFISKYIHSVEQLEILLLLAGSTSTMLPIPVICRHVQSSESSIARCLEELQNQGFLISQKMPGLVYQFSPNSEELRVCVQALASIYKEKKIRVIELIFGKSEDQLRHFSDAFKFKRDKHVS